MAGPNRELSRRLRSLEKHLKNENPLLVDAVRSFRRLDRIAYRMGLLARSQTYASRIAWWPLVSILGTFSAGKSTFINHYIGYPLQATGTQAVDEKFTVLCYTTENEARVLPGIALNGDLRFPFYKMSEELEKVRAGEGGRVDAYLQLKTCPSKNLRGQIFIDSPGFDADAQRTATLRIINYIINLSDLVLVFFDARHPEPGAMRDTLDHLVAHTIKRPDSSKFLYVLNQIDTSARENNPEDVVGAWQRAIAQKGLTAGRFYCIYNPDAAIPIEDDALRQRFEAKRDKDMADIHNRIKQVSYERAYRIVGALEKTAREFQEQKVNKLKEFLHRWRRRVWMWEGILVGALLALYLAVGLWTGAFVQGVFLPTHYLSFLGAPWDDFTVGVIGLCVIFAFYFLSRKWAAKSVIQQLNQAPSPGPERESLTRAFLKNTRPWRIIQGREPVGWGPGPQKQIQRVLNDVDRCVQTLNDRFARPSGELRKKGKDIPAPAPPLAEAEIEKKPAEVMAENPPE